MKGLWTKLKTLVSPQATNISIDDLEVSDLVGRNGKVHITRIRDLADGIGESTFSEFFKCPFLVGAGVYGGTTEPYSQSGRWRRLSATRVFFRNQLQEILEGQSLENTVFPLRKNLSHRPLSPQYGDLLIGRDLACDIRIPDPTISRHHAKLSITPEGFTLSDCGAKNAITVNGGRIAQTKKLEFDDAIKLGRFEFRFITAEELYRRITPTHV